MFWILAIESGGLPIFSCSLKVIATRSHQLEYDKEAHAIGQAENVDPE